MADGDVKDLDLDVEDEKPKSKLMLFVIIGVVVLLGGGAAAYFLLMSDSSESESAAEAEQVSTKAPAIYLPLKPPFVVTYMAGSRQRFVQITVSLMTRDEEAVGAIEQHMPLIRNNLVTVFGLQEFEELKSQEGKEAMRQAALEEIQMIIEEELGKPGVEQVLFTNFVIQ